MKKTLPYVVPAVVVILLTSIAFTRASHPAPEDHDKIQWMSWEEAVAAHEREKKKILIDVYTDWCHWCKVMDKKTFSKSNIAKYVNTHFYAVKLNAEGKEDIHWNDKVFKFQPAGRRGTHALAQAMLDGQMSYPSFVFLNENFERIRISKGFKSSDHFMDELKFAAEERYRDKSDKP